MHVHFESLTSNPPTFQIQPGSIEDAKIRHPELAQDVETSYGQDLVAISEWGSRTEALVTAFNVLTQPTFPLRDIRGAFPRLRWIHLTSAGIDKVLPLDWLPPDVLLTNSSGIHQRKASEYAFFSLIALNMRLPQIVSRQLRREWHQLFTPSIADRTALIVGLGTLGTAAARAAKNLGMRVLGVRRGREPHGDVDELFPIAQLMDVLPRADILYVAVPLTFETRGLIGAHEFDVMKVGAGLVNVSRAPVVDYDQLALRLNDGRIAGAVLDVFDPEPLPASSTIWQIPNLIITPHVGMDERDDYIAHAIDLFYRSVPDVRNGRMPPTAIDRELGY